MCVVLSWDLVSLWLHMYILQLCSGKTATVNLFGFTGSGLSISFGVAGECVKVGGQTFWGVRGYAPPGKFLKM